MTPAHDQAVRDGADAELRGDAAEALRLHRSVPMFRRSTHGDRLHQLRELGAAAPGWVINRWLTIQARRRVWTGAAESETNRTLQLVIPLIYPDGIPIEKIGCTWPEQVVPFIYERDWVARQVDVYDLGGLRRLVERHASPALLDRSDRIDAWCGAPMRACRVESVPDNRTGSMSVVDLSGGDRLEVMDLGAEVLPGQCVLGRVVPTTAEPGLMFDWRPLPVPEGVARAVAADPRRWLPTLHSLTVRGTVEPGFTHLPEGSLTTDLPYRSWLTLVGVPLDECPDHDPAPVFAKALTRVLELAAHGADALMSRRHPIGDLVIDPLFDQAMRWRYVDRELESVWRTLADVVPDHARSRCAEQALWCSAAPDHPDAIA
jgi:hypothetical protein